MAQSREFLFDPSVRVKDEVVTITNLRKQLKALPRNKQGELLVHASVLDGLLQRVEQLHEFANRFEYSSDGFVKRYPEESEFDKVLNNDPVESSDDDA